jgi:hypothetical protein
MRALETIVPHRIMERLSQGKDVDRFDSGP